MKKLPILLTPLVFSCYAIASTPAMVSSQDAATPNKPTTTKAHTAEKSSKNKPAKEDVIVVSSSVATQISAPFVIDAEKIKQGTIGDGNVTDLLKTSPAVQLSNSGNSGEKQGEIKPSDISIHGSVSYQNSYMLDGVNFNNDLDPADSGLGITATKVDSDEQGVYIDSRLISEVKLYDNNIPVEYGGFTGGVVDVVGRQWSHQNAGSLYYGKTHSSWNKTHVDPRIDFDSSHNDVSRPNRYQPKYSKQNYGGWLEFGLSDNVGVIISGSRRESDISSVSYIGDSVVLDANGDTAVKKLRGGMRDQTRTADSLSTKFTWEITPNTTSNFSVNYSKYNNYSFAATVANSGYDTAHKGLNTIWQLQHNFDAAKWEMTASYQRLEDVRTNDQNYFITFKSFEMVEENGETIIDWGKDIEFNSGGSGDLKTQQNNVSFKNKLTFNPIMWGMVQHAPTLGFEIAQIKARYIRDNNFFRYSYNGFHDDKGNIIGVMEPGEPSYVTAFENGKHKADYTTNSYFMDDTMEYGKFTLRPGLRIDYDDFIRHANLAPRLVGSYDVQGNGNTLLSAGVNRYYGRSMLAYALYDAQNAGLKQCYFDCDTSDLSDWMSTSDTSGLDNLKTPYNDEVSVGIDQIVSNSLWKLQYVHRESRDEVRSRPDAEDANMRIFDNSGRGSHDTLSLTVRNRLPWQFLQASHVISSSVSWQKSKSNTPKDSGYAHFDPDNKINTDKVWYEGKLINAASLPATDFNIPVKINVELTSSLPQYGLTFYNLLQWNSPRSQAVRYINRYHTDETTGTRSVEYSKEKFASFLRWDMKANWKPAFAYGANISVEANNLLNRKSVTDRYAYGVQDNGDPRVIDAYAPGRQFWVQVGYDF